MKPTEVHIVQLRAMRVASAYGFGEQPEQLAWQQLSAWARPRGLLNDPGVHPLYGFNNPYPTPDSPRYGYEFWIKVGAECEPADKIRIVEFMGGSYATMRCEIAGHPESIPEGWQILARWCQEHGHKIGKHTALEEFIGTPDYLDSLVLILYCPIVE